jgi:hypothetical protein
MSETTYNTSKYLLAVSVDSYEVVQELARSLESVGIGVFKASAIDKEFYGHAPKNSYVLRSLNGMSAESRKDTKVEW